MVKIRPLDPKDHERLIAYAFACSEGLTSMPKDLDVLKHKLYLCQKSFESTFFEADTLLNKAKKLFLFVLENENGLVVGFSGIKTHIGAQNWALSYKNQDTPLEWVELSANLSELCSLYLDPQERHHFWGKALSYCRFFFMQTYPDFFEKRLLAQLRGWILASNQCPFWDEIKVLSGDSQSLLLDFKRAHHLIATGRATPRELLPGKLPSFNQFSKILQPFIGHAHDQTAPAEKLLQEINFQKQHRFDALDAGPHYEKDLVKCPLLSKIQSWNLSVGVKPIEKTTLALIDTSKSKAPFDFELELVNVAVDEKNHSLILDASVFEKIGRQRARALPLQETHN